MELKPGALVRITEPGTGLPTTDRVLVGQLGYLLTVHETGVEVLLLAPDPLYMRGRWWVTAVEPAEGR